MQTLGSQDDSISSNVKWDDRAFPQAAKGSSQVQTATQPMDRSPATDPTRHQSHVQRRPQLKWSMAPHSDYQANSSLLHQITTQTQMTVSACRLKEVMADLRAPPVRAQHRATHINRALSTCTHVFVRRDVVKTPLQPPYDGHCKVLRRQEKY